ncbi:serine/threonine-protein phosphatase 6 regulatory ankyrin repeat subunit C-like [Mizuhopecten yessoensis]|uniref:Ankyrin repeat and SOCS box protein 8 n=1 Tax=Mizuhopecten yessoensis TaxID=6573 RepID=A0A210R6M6_MIZYE|nr:serine/threonine-protein phosphatase 6 regulatory ankyrin repeat subunit C-like [Mizuhopecten yessoensis]XP_021347063.1 serine/threonine-protein phosphatase 6 regulatory ankyrin repeat subunit C-like [Mizuhopecten yessoensis]OWF56556.1 Ankyrin repeat and SOCS box protein 8 [Mizuhopecten yessoensis]
METEVSTHEKWQCLLSAVVGGSLQKVTDIIKTFFPKSNMSQTYSCSPGIFKENPPLHQAVLTASDEIVLLLIENGFDIHARNRYQETTLHMASRKGRDVIVHKLLESGADIDSRDCEENTPLFNAATYSHPHIAHVLIQAGSDINTLNEELMTPLDQAILYDQRETISILLKAGCEVKKDKGYIYYEDHYVNSIVHSLWQNGDSSNIKLLQNCGYEMKYSDIKRLVQWKYHVVQGADIPDTDKAVIEDILTQPLPLMNCCRISVRDVLSKVHRKCTLEKLSSQLPLPKSLKDFIAFKV